MDDIDKIKAVSENLMLIALSGQHKDIENNLLLLVETLDSVVRH